MVSPVLWTFFCRMAVIGNILHLYRYCANVSEIKSYDSNYGKTWMFFPDEDGNPQVIELTEPDPNLRISLAHEDPDAKIVLWLFNKHHRKPKKLKTTGADRRDDFTIDDSFDGIKKTKIIIHGWKNNLNSDVIQLLKNAYLEEPEDYNIVAVDWGEMANDNNYLRSAASTRNVGKHVASVIDHMISIKNARLEDIHVIGHSLGAHAAGFAGMYTSNIRKGHKVGRITGLDPAFPAFQDHVKTDLCLDPSDAEFVDVIHTCSGILGHNKNLGHADFFPNGGKAGQPGCDFASDFVGACSHGRSFKYFSESIHTKNGFLAYECESWDDYNEKKCNGDPVPMGDSTPSTANGTYFLETSDGPTSYARLLKIN